ncbi:MAG: gamma-glutamylcyclotransferase [Gemmatimonadetes bacterium]|nr:gamma-glutamylcyclotransferase [Gemmatimonadota bacterium]
MSGHRRDARPVHVFVYGTLRSGSRTAELLRGCTRLRAASVRGTLYEVDRSYPALVLAGGDVIHGEIWSCRPEQLGALDDYERVAEGLFRRVGVRVGDVACWTYVAGPKLARLLTPRRRIASGVWSPDA